MKKIDLFRSFAIIIYCFLFFAGKSEPIQSWIRINQLGYTPEGIKVAVFCSKNETIKSFSLIDSATKRTILSNTVGKKFGTYGPFKNTYRLNFSSCKKNGTYYLKAGATVSAYFKINDDVYLGAADFCLFYLRQQRSGFNPFLKDSCHTHDGYTMYGPMPDSTHINVSGGWHDASDYLQYATTSANATYHLLAAYRDFPKVFGDKKMANGLDGKNQIPDVLDEAMWGLNWLLKMHPKKEWMFNQLADDRDHMGMRIPKEDSFYGKGYERPVYFISGEPQGLFKYKNRTTGTSSTAAKFSSAFALGAQLFYSIDTLFSRDLRNHSFSALQYASLKPGVTQTAPGRAPYFYEEDNWVDDMELAYASPFNESNISENQYLDTAYSYALREPVTPWLGSDTAKHYQWYPFINLGHYELAKQLKGKRRDTINNFYKAGIERVWKKAKQNAFYRGIPFIWCSNNLTTSFAIQCNWYNKLTGDKTFNELEQSNIDWLFGCNPWGTSMVYGLPAWGDTPVDPHSAFTHLKNYPINGGLIDGPVYASINKNHLGSTLNKSDVYAEFQSDLAVYHDDYGDYSTNEPTMDGTASLVYLLAAMESRQRSTWSVTSLSGLNTVDHGAIIRGNSSQKQIALVFTADEFADGAKIILPALERHHIKASFFLTGNFLRNVSYRQIINQIKAEGHYIGPHSDQHLLYCDWSNRDSLLVTHKQFRNDLEANLRAIEKYGIKRSDIKYFLPPFEWYNDSIAAWTNKAGMQLINYSPGTKSTADYTWPGLMNYHSSAEIYSSIIDKEKEDVNGLNGFILLVHFGTDNRRTDKFYNRFDDLLRALKDKGYRFTTIDRVLR